jgi:hypothetical protein
MKQFIPKVEKVANVGTNEPFLARIVMGLPEILDVADFEEKDKIKESIMEIFINGLLPAFSHLQELRSIESGKKEKLVIDLNKAYFGFYDRIRAVYKDKMQRTAKFMGFEIGFMFQSDKVFEKGILGFKKAYPNVHADVIDAMRKNRIGWQNAVARFRNDYAEHQTIFEKDVEELRSLKSAEICFNNCWTAIERILGELICSKLYRWAGIEEIPESERDQSMPKRFRILYRM